MPHTILTVYLIFSLLVFVVIVGLSINCTCYKKGFAMSSPKRVHELLKLCFVVSGYEMPAVGEINWYHKTVPMFVDNGLEPIKAAETFAEAEKKCLKLLAFYEAKNKEVVNADI